MAFYNVVLCFTMLNGQIPFVCFFYNSVLVRTIFSEAPLINNGCATHVRALLIFYSAAAPNALSVPSRVLKAFVRQLRCGPRRALRPPPPPGSVRAPQAPGCLREARWPPANPLLSATASVTRHLQRPLRLPSGVVPRPRAELWAQGPVTVGGANPAPAPLLWLLGTWACLGEAGSAVWLWPQTAWVRERGGSLRPASHVLAPDHNRAGGPEPPPCSHSLSELDGVPGA